MAVKQRVLWTPHEGPQTVFLQSPAFECLYGGAVGGGKSQAILYNSLRQVHIPDYRGLILRKTFPELRELMDEAAAVFPDLGATWMQSEKRAKFPSGATIEFGYAESYGDVLQYRGQQYQYVAYDEIGDLPDERVWTFLLTRIRSGADPRLVKMARCTANPGGAGHGWLKRRFISVCPPDGTIYFDPETGNTRAFVQAKVKDNPTLLKNDPDYMKRLLVLSPVEREQLLEGNWDAGSGLAFEGLTATSHLVEKEPVPSWASCFGAFDWGFGHKWSFSVAYMKPTTRGSVMHVIDSASGRRHTPDVIVDRVRDLLKARGLDFSRLAYTVAGSDVKIRDEARGSFGPSVMEQFGNYGWFLMNADNSRVAGYQNLLRYIAHRLIEWENTPGNVADVAILRDMAMDPDYPNDVKKVDVHPVTGEGGDDAYDKTRYMAMSRPLASVEPVEQLSRAVMRGHLQSPSAPRHVLNVEMPRMDGGYATTSTRV